MYVRHSSVEPYTYVHYQDLYDLLRALSLQKVSLVSLSGGARSAIDMAITHPEMVQKLVAVSPGVSGCVFVDEWTQQQGKKLGEAMSQQNMAQAIEVFLTMWVDGPYRTAAQMPPAMRERVHEMVMRSVSQNIMALDMHELEPPAIGRLSEIQAPTLIVLGEKDTSDIHTIGRLLHRNVAESELVIVPDTGHMLSMEKPSEFNSLVERFLRA